MITVKLYYPNLLTPIILQYQDTGLRSAILDIEQDLPYLERIDVDLSNADNSNLKVELLQDLSIISEVIEENEPILTS